MARKLAGYLRSRHTGPIHRRHRAASRTRCQNATKHRGILTNGDRVGAGSNGCGTLLYRWSTGGIGSDRTVTAAKAPDHSGMLARGNSIERPSALDVALLVVILFGLP